MIIFLNKKNKTFLVTNYKVMYSTLLRQKQLKVLRGVGFLWYYFYYSIFYPGTFKKYLIVRDPYRRLVSFFNDKFRQVLLDYPNHDEWQQCQQLFFEPLGIAKDASAKDIRQSLLETTFDKVIALLPRVYTQDKHLTPQAWAKKKCFKKLGIRLCVNMSYDRVIKMEDTSALHDLAKELELDLNINVNKTKSRQQPIVWDETSKAIVNKLYKNDFETFKYDF